MNLLKSIRKNMKVVVFSLALVFVSFAIGAYTGIVLYKDRLTVVAAGLWGKGANIAKRGDYDHALYYFSQAIALDKTEPVYYHSVAEAYEAKQNTLMALEFYKIALQQYKKSKAGPIGLVDEKIRLLEGK